MSCRWQDNATLYADGELDPALQEGFERHLSDCMGCLGVVSEHLELKSSLRRAGSRFSAPPDLHATVFRSVHPAPGVSPWWKWVLAPLVASLLGVIGFLAYPKSAGDPMVARLVDQHVTNLASANPVDVVSSDRHTVKPWYQGRLPFTLNLPELGGSSFQLLGGKIAYAGQQPGAQLWYAAGAHKISVFVFQARGAGSGPAASRDYSFNVDRWTQNGLAYYLVTDASPDEAGKLVTMFREANRP